MALFRQRIKDIHDKLEKEELTVQELVEHSLKRIKETDDKVQAIVKIDEEQAVESAKKLDEQRKSSEKGKLFGLPIGLKDNILTKGLRTTCSSKMLENFEPLYDATVADKVHNAQAVVVGKLNMDEFAMGGTTETSAFKQTKNPWNLERVPGGSSGGSAAAVAAGQVYFALGSDTGGSIRQPASFCGVVGLKPTYGLVSRFGVVGFASSLDQVGPITKTVEDNAYLLQVIAGFDPNDSTSVDMQIPNYVDSLTGDIKGLRIAVPKEFFGEGVDEAVKASVKNALAELEKLGAVCEEVSLPHVKYAPATYYIISSAEASSSLARFDGVRYGYRSGNVEKLQDVYFNSRSEGFGEEVKSRIILGTFALSMGNYEAVFEKAQKVRTLIKQDLDSLFEKYDVIIGPTAPSTAYAFGEIQNDSLKAYTNDLLTTPVNLAGIPAISVPCGFHEGLPIGLQIMGKPFAEATIYRVAHAFEQATEFHKQTPVL
jgi:aspartyl-tRNA(Asn)/glutamyl-tRNA(Gln) amidotransferase subunit A